ncbi:MAG: DUF503 domain-containing protein [Flexistipes sinusarabici]|uniref:DUF503 domain-containing protein n=1 Tax=Flexistipes sinusarabici TaxID=2352 RepID=A0A5D0MQP4_FLESI|nr:DUF503 domain-containing protein [Flexistipes sinusarabici]TYB33738.1 MAG: DUF503 domain-containing protein [Flexistipes sinusarabici]
MTIGSVVFELDIDSAFSLKEKRRVLNSLKTRLKNKFNVAVAEVGEKDVWNRADLAIVTLADNRSFLDSQLQEIINFVDMFHEVVIMHINQEIF